MFENNHKAIALLNSFFSESREQNHLISAERQLAVIEDLKKGVPFEQFFFVVNLITNELEHIHGVTDWLGYTNSTMTLPNYLKYIHPKHLPNLAVAAYAAMEGLKDSGVNAGFLSPRVVANVPILHANGTYYLTKRTLYPFQINSEGKVTAYLNCFVLLREFDEEKDSLHIRVNTGYSLTNTYTQQIFKRESEEFLKSKKRPIKLNKRELDIVVAIANEPGITHQELASQLAIPVGSIRKTYNHRILSKARSYYNTERFESLRDLAMFLKQEGVI